VHTVWQRHLTAAETNHVCCGLHNQPIICSNQMYTYIDLGVKKHSTAKDTLFFKKLSVGLNQIQTDGLSQQTVD